MEHSDTKYDGGGTITISKKLTIYGPGYLLAENNYPVDSTQADSRPGKIGKIIFDAGSERTQQPSQAMPCPGQNG